VKCHDFQLFPEREARAGEVGGRNIVAAISALAQTGPYEEYGKWMPEVPLTRSVPDSFYKEDPVSGTLPIRRRYTVRAARRRYQSAARGGQFAAGLADAGAARGAWLEFDFPDPQRLEYIAVRDWPRAGRQPDPLRAD